MVKIINTSGKRKTAIARATLKAGKGVIRINSVPLETYGSDTTRMKIAEPLLLIPNAVNGIDVTIDVAVAVLWDRQKQSGQHLPVASSSGTTTPR